MRRNPAVAGQFYYDAVSKLDLQVRQYTDKSALKEKAIAIVSPHAGLVYSGSVAGAVYSGIEFPETFILLGPNHTGVGPKISLMESGEWAIPTGVFEIDKTLAQRISLNTGIVTKDTQAHMFEHSLEVQLPFIAYFSRNVKIVPVAILSASLEECRILGEGIAKSIKDSGHSVVIVASSDMSHYIPEETARKKDTMAIDRILAIDPEGMHETVLREKISMCGYLPVTAALYAAKALGARSARLVKYTTSAEVSGDYDHVVGYSGIIIR